MVRLRGAEDLHHARQEPLGTGAHVDGLDRQPHRVDADHRSQSRSHAAHVPAAWPGQAMLTVVAPRRSSMRMSGAGCAVGGAGNCSATNALAILASRGGASFASD